MVKRSDSMVETVGETQRLQTTMHALQLDLLGFLNVGFAQDNQSICPFLETITMTERDENVQRCILFHQFKLQNPQDL